MSNSTQGCDMPYHCAKQENPRWSGAEMSLETNSNDRK